VILHDGEGLFRIDLPGNPSPHSLYGSTACLCVSARRQVFNGFAVAGVELLPVEDSYSHIAGVSKPFGFRDGVKGISFARSVQKRGQSMRLTSAERSAKLQHPVVAGLTDKGLENFFEE
jgi:hypothetical protein